MTPQHQGAGPRDTVLVAAARTPIGRFNGALRELDAVSLGAAAIKGALDRTGGLVPERILMGNVVQGGNGQNPARAAAVKAGLSQTVPGTTLNDVCLASMTAVALASTMIGSGEIDSALVGGFESMSRALHGIQLRQAAKVGEPVTVDMLTSDGLWCSISDEGMGALSDAANHALHISRQDQDAYALASHQKAQAARTSGHQDGELVPMEQLRSDEGIRSDSTLTTLASLPPAFTPSGTITAGNASQMSDAGAAGILTSRQLAERTGLTPVARVTGHAVVAGPDPTLHLRPAEAAAKLLANWGMVPSDVGVWEINEAFAGVVLATARELHLDLDRINVHGGAIAIGHPLGASGFRIIMSLATAMAARGEEIGIATICGGGGQGSAVMLRLE